MFGKSEKAAALAADITDFKAVRGRSLFRDAMGRFLRNKAAMASVVVLALIVAFVIIGPHFAVWDNEEIDWARMGDILAQGAPSVETGHFFGLDELGRDLYSRTIQATQTSLLVGLIGAAMALRVGTAWGVIAGFYGGRLDSVIGLVTPPVGTVLFTVARVADIPFGSLVREVLPFYIPLFGMLLAITFLPWLVTLVPQLLLH